MRPIRHALFRAGLRILSVACVCLWMAAAAHAQGRRIALVIGNSNYQQADLPKLANPANDAEDMAQALRGFGFEVIERKNQTLEDMNRAIAEFGSRIGASDAALFYYAGHGIQVKNQNYLIPVNARIESEAAVPYQSVNLNQVLDEMDNAKSAANIVLLDACRNNPLSGKFRSGATRGLAVPGTPPKGTVIVYATDPGNVAADGSGRNGLFTAGLLSAFKGRDLSLDGVLTAASAEVEQASGQTQTPYVNGPKTLQKNFRFITSVASGSTTAAPAMPSTAAQSSAFDGHWAVSMVCEDLRDREGRLVKGYAYNFFGDVKDGRFHGQYGQLGQRSSMALVGDIQPDGKAVFNANGLSGNAESTVGYIRPSSPYAFSLRGNFSARSGKATRVELRPCEASFLKY